MTALPPKFTMLTAVCFQGLQQLTAQKRSSSCPPPTASITNGARVRVTLTKPINEQNDRENCEELHDANSASDDEGHAVPAHTESTHKRGTIVEKGVDAGPLCEQRKVR